MRQYPSVSVIVPVLNREDDIGRCLDSLLRLDYPRFEIIVVDNGSTDKTREVVSRYPVKIVVEKKPGAYAARNRGIELSQGEIVAFTDSDCIIEKEWLNNLTEAYSDEKVGGVGGQVLPYKTERLVNEFLSLGPLEIFHSPERVQIKRQTNRFLSGAMGSGNMSYRKSVLREVKGFSEDLVVCGDYDLSWRVQGAGYRLVYEPKAIVYHKLRGTISQLVHQFFGLGKSEPALLKKQPEGFSYVEIKTYLFSAYEFRCKLPIQMLLTIDFLNLAIFSLILAFIYPAFLYVFSPLCLMVLWQAWRRTKEAVRKTKRMRWLLLFPILHIIRSYSFTLGRIVGGLRHRIISV
jgi:glycosyltransferase involved in cell wall biosynthesis